MGPPEQPPPVPEPRSDLPQPPDIPRRARWFAALQRWRVRGRIVFIVLLAVCLSGFIVNWNQVIGRDKVKLIRSLEVGQIEKVTVYWGAEDSHRLLSVIDDPEQLAPFVRAMNRLKRRARDYSNYTVPWYLVIHLQDGRTVELNCWLKSWPDKTVYVRPVPGGALFAWHLSDASSPAFYDWMLAHSWPDGEAYLNIPVVNEWTVLHWAALGGHQDIAELLLQQGADVNVLSVRNETPLDLAVEGNKESMVAFLCDRGAKTGKELNP